MRWGVRDDATDTHMTTELCLQEIKACQEISVGPNFVVSVLIFIDFFIKKTCHCHSFLFSTIHDVQHVSFYK